MTQKKKKRFVRRVDYNLDPGDKELLIGFLLGSAMTALSFIFLFLGGPDGWIPALVMISMLPVTFSYALRSEKEVYWEEAD